MKGMRKAMKAIVTGASSGIGKDIAKQLIKRGYKVIAVAREEQKLKELQKELGNQVEILSMDLANEENCMQLYEKYKEDDIDIVVNNAGFGDFGEFVDTNLEKELNMIKTNIVAVHILTKMFLKEMIKKDKGYILNVASIAGFMPGPLMATYYSTKSYVVKLTQSIYEELRRKKSNVGISVLCPGPVATNFDNVAGVRFSLKQMKSEYVAEYAVKNMFRKKLIIIPGIIIKTAKVLSKISPDKLVARVAYKQQKRKRN